MSDSRSANHRFPREVYVLLSASQDRRTRQTLHGISAGGTSASWMPGDIYADECLGFVVVGVLPGEGPAAHVQPHHDQAFCLLEGELELIQGDTAFTVLAGDLVHVARGVRHRFVNLTSHAAKLACLFNPGGRQEANLKGCERPHLGQQLGDCETDHFTPRLMDVFEQLENILHPEK
ncbi:cupin domain-containing protein [Streptomyces sp. NPDC093228]|uniref:cupin domain-containing protein n=1 Tax=Streptomyces sp. NPDC093228 TaxID=3155070 RepID=UPI00344A4BD5